MAKEILLYNPIYSFTAANYINELEANKNVDISVRMNCPGGDVYSAYGMIAKFNEHSKGKVIKVDGMAKSCGFYMCAGADNVECLDVSDFLAHRAALPSYVESDKEVFTDDVKAMLNKVNASLRATLESKVSADTFKTVTGVSLDDMFSLDSRVDVEFSAEQALKMGLVNKVNKLTSEKKTEIMALSASHGIAAFAKDAKIEITEEKLTNIMTAAEFKVANPTAYAEIVAEGAKCEKSRVKAWMAFNAIDAEAVKAGIESGADMTMEVMAEMSVKAIAGSTLEQKKKENIDPLATAEAPAKEPTAEEKNAAEFLATCKKDLKLN